MHTSTTQIYCLVLWNILNLLVMDSIQADGGSTQYGNKTDFANTIETKHTLQNQNSESWKHEATDLTTTFDETKHRSTELIENTSVTDSVIMATQNWSPCEKSSNLQQVTIQGTGGQVYSSLQGNCEFTLEVPPDKIVMLRINVCTSIVLDIQDSVNTTTGKVILLNMLCYRSKPIPVMYSLSNKMMIKLDSNTLAGQDYPTLSLYFSAVDQSEKPSLQLVYLSPTLGYIQTPGWDGSTLYPPLMKSCVTLTPPADHVIFITFNRLDIERSDYLLHFPGPCTTVPDPDSSTLAKVYRSMLIFPDDFWIPSNQNDQEIPLTFFFSSNVRNELTGFKLHFSFHKKDLKPRRVEGSKETDRRWNCSLSVWPDLMQHFPCDLVPQCAQAEDEARCSYTSDRCGLNQVEAGGRCYIYGRPSYRSWSDSDTECRRRGALLVSLESYEELHGVVKLLQHADTTKTWIGLERTGKKIHNTKYANTWLWVSGSVAYYVAVGFTPNINFCGQLRPRSSTMSLAEKITSFGCDSNDKASFLCELPDLSNGISKTITLPVPSITTTTRAPLITCPLQHVTHEMLACDLKSVCWGKVEGEGIFDSLKCQTQLSLAPPYYDCGEEPAVEFVPYTLVCDFRPDCSNAADEAFCVHSLCLGLLFNCGQKQCVDYRRRCDGEKDCISNRDEESCPNTIISNDIKEPAVVNFNKPGGFSVTPLPDNVMQCPDTHFQCPGDGYCLPVYVRCNGVNDCPGHEDEAGCDAYRCTGFYRCRGTDRTVCVHVDHLCDGVTQCPQQDDELICNIICPEQCTCYGLAFTCTDTFDVSSYSQLRYLEARGSRLLQSDVTHNVMLIHLGVGSCGWSNLTHFTLPNLRSLDLSDNLLRHINFGYFVGSQNLQKLILVGNPISESLIHDNRNYLLPSLQNFKFSGVLLNTLHMDSLFAIMPNLHVLDFSQSGIRSLQGKGAFQDLKVLDLRGCPVSDFTPDFMKSMSSLRYVYADNFKLCCSAVLPDLFQGLCSAPSDVISSCDDLLKSNIYRYALAIFAVLATLGNFGSFVYRIFISSEKINIGFAIFVLHLCVADFLMGVYLAFIGLADRVYAGIYLWSDITWKSSVTCSIAGFLSFLSSEASAFLICLITLDRFLVIRFPFSRVRFGATSAHIACVIIWTLGLILALVPLLPVTSHWAFYSQTGICIPLPTTSADFAGYSYSFSIMIVLNLVLFLMIAVGQSLIYWSVKANTLSGQKIDANDNVSGNAKSKEAIIARRLLSIAMSDFLCWFPIGLCGLLSAVGVVIPGEVNVVMAIFVLPLNSALNPFLYTFIIMMEKRQRAQEFRLQKFLNAQLKSASHPFKSMN